MNYPAGLYETANLNPYPAELRAQLYPLCCGFTVISGFKDAGSKTEAGLTEELQTVMKKVPYNQVYTGEKMMPKTFSLVLNTSQMGSPKIVNAVRAAGFMPVATWTGWSGKLTMWINGPDFESLIPVGALKAVA